MQESAVKKNIERIIWKYCTARQSSNFPLRDELNELALFLFENKGQDTGNLIHMVRGAFGDNCKYIPGFLSSDEEAFLLDHYSEVIEMIVDSSFGQADHRLGGRQPKEITEFMAQFFKPQKEYSQTVSIFGEKGPLTCVSRFFNPFTGLGSYVLALPDYDFDGEEINGTIWALLQIRLHAQGRLSSFSNTNFFFDQGKGDDEIKYKGIITTPPFGQTGDYSIERIVSRLYDALEENGQLVMIVTPGFLFSGSRVASDVKLRLLKDKAITDIILLPEGLYNGTAIGTAVLVIEKCAHPSMNITDASFAYKTIGKNRIFDKDALAKAIIYQDAERPVSIQLGYDELANNDCNLNPATLIANKAFNTGFTISGLAGIAPVVNVSEEINAPFFSPSDLHPDFARTPIDVDKLEQRDIKPGRYYYIDSPVVLFDYKTHSDQVRVAYLDTAPARPFYASVFAVALLPNDAVSPQYLMLILSDPQVRRQLSALTQGATIRRINTKLLPDIFVPVHSAEEQKEMVLEAMKASMTQAERELEESFAKYREAIHSRKHALSQSISSLSALWNRLDYYRKNHESISSDDLIGRKHTMTVADVFDKISGYLNTICEQTEAIADISFDWGEPDWINMPFYIFSYIRKHESPDYAMISLGGDQSSLNKFNEDMKNHGVLEALKMAPEPEINNILFPQKALNHIINNIVANAVAHGFTDSTRDNYKISFDWKEEDGNVVVYISNNGKPLHPDFDPASVLRYGTSENLNEHGHKGLGGHEIKSIMEQFGGYVEVISTPDEEYTVTYKLTFTHVSQYLPEDEFDN